MTHDEIKSIARSNFFEAVDQVGMYSNLSEAFDAYAENAHDSAISLGASKSELNAVDSEFWKLRTNHRRMI